jgi:hypothetical protein
MVKTYKNHGFPLDFPKKTTPMNPPISGAPELCRTCREVTEAKTKPRGLEKDDLWIGNGVTTLW